MKSNKNENGAIAVYVIIIMVIVSMGFGLYFMQTDLMKKNKTIGEQSKTIETMKIDNEALGKIVASKNTEIKMLNDHIAVLNDIAKKNEDAKKVAERNLAAALALLPKPKSKDQEPTETADERTVASKRIGVVWSIFCNYQPESCKGN